MIKTNSLRGKITQATILAVTILASALVIMMIIFMNYLTDVILLQTMRPMARTTALSIQGNLHTLADRIFLIRDNALLSSPEASREQRQQVLDMMLSGIEFVWLGQYGIDGELETGNVHCPLTIRNRPLFAEMLATQNLVIDDIQTGSGGGLEIVIGAPVFSGQEITSYLVGSYQYDVLNDVLGNISISSTSTAYIINEMGKFMAHRNVEMVRSGESIFLQYPPGPDLDYIMMKLSKEQIEAFRLKGGNKIIATAPVRGTQWSLVIEVSRNDFMPAGMRGVAVIILITLALLVIFILVSDSFITRILTKPLGVITENARRINRGLFNLGFPEEVLKRQDEIGQLTGAFLSMSRSIEGVIGEIDWLASEVGSGRLDQRSKLSSLEGNYLKIISGVNGALDLICSHLDAIPMALALFNERREMLFHNHAMDDFLLFHGLEADDRQLLEQIAGSGNMDDVLLDPLAAALFDPHDPAPQPYSSEIAMLGANGGGDFMVTIQRVVVDGPVTAGPSAGFCVMLLLNDVTMLAQARFDAEAASHAKSDFLSRMSHEIRTPMNAIIGMTQIAKSSDDMSKLHNCLEQVESSSNHLLGVINDILDFSKIESGKLTLDITEFSLSADLEFVVSMMLPKARERNINIGLNIGSIQNDAISSDSLRLNQVLINLLSNAVKFSPKGSEVMVNARELGSEDGFSTFSFEVVDHGIGISEYNAQKLFRPFEQADGGITRNYGGSGLGLVISKNLVEMMGGTIGLASKEGEGSTFTFTIICAAKTAVEQKSGGEKDTVMPVNFDFSGKRCLVVDDVEINREIILELLSGTGITMETAENGKQAVDKFAGAGERYYDIILMDMQMPVMDGCTATRRIRALEEERRAKETPVIAMTANVMQEDVQRAKDAGMNAHLGKPIELDAMFRVLQEQLFR